MKRSSLAERRCPVSRAAAQVVDAWTFVILRELFLGNRRFEGLRLHSGMSPRSLALRLARLAGDGIVEKRAGKRAAKGAAADTADTSGREAPAPDEYRLTAKGLELWPVLVTLRQWGERWSGPWGRGGPPLTLRHRGHGHGLHARLVCAECGEPVDAHAAEVVPTPAALREREAFAAAVAAATPISRRPRRPS